MAETEARPLRGCDACGLVDDHPRHVYGLDYLPVEQHVQTPPEIASQMIANTDDPNVRMSLLAHIQDNTTVIKHFDCCRAAGCPDGSCGVVTAGAEDLRGKDLVEHLTGPKAKAAATRAGLNGQGE